VQSHEDTFYLIAGEAEAQFYNNNPYAESWDWDFGDSGTDTIKDPLHTYTDTGTYTVNVTVSHQYCSKTAEKTIYIVDDTGIGIPDFKNLSGLLIKITGLNGHNKTTIPVTSEKTLINTSGWVKGTYVCNLVVEGKIVRSEKMVLK
jgi:PKD repeat protein